MRNDLAKRLGTIDENIPAASALCSAVKGQPALQKFVFAIGSVVRNGISVYSMHTYLYVSVGYVFQFRCRNKYSTEININ